MRDLIDRYRELERNSADLLTKLNMLNGGIASKQDDVLAAQKRVDEAEKKIAFTNLKLQSTQKQLDEQQALLEERAVASYIGGPRNLDTGLALLKASTADDVGKTLEYGDAIVDDEKAIIRKTVDLKHEVEDLRRQATQQRDEAQAASDRLTAERKGLEGQRDDILKAESDLQKNAQAKIALLSDAARQQMAVEAGFAKVQAVRDSISNTLATRQLGQTPPARTLGIFLSPIPHPKINQPFGASVDPIFGVTRGHPGIDMNGATGDPIRAPADGVVVAAGWIDGYGNCTILDHGQALGTLYGHQSLIAVKEGDVVRRGQVIGFVGSTGYSTGPHLHWEVRILGNVTDPAPFIGDTN